MRKQVYITLDVLRCEKYELNPTQSILASYLFSRISASAPHTITQVGNDLYYRADYDFTAENCPLLPGKPDTLRRLYKELEEKGLISILKIGRNVCFAPTKELREWGTEMETTPILQEAEKNPQEAEKNPQEAEKNPQEAEKNPLYINNIKQQENKERTQTLFAPDLFQNEIVEKENSKKTLFRNSEVYKMVKETEFGLDYSEFESHFATPEFAPVDLVYYFHAVSDWSDQKTVKRTKNGWLATVRNFIRGDVEKKKLHLKPTAATQQTLDVAGAMAYLKNDL